jgi:hypothetical protein
MASYYTGIIYWNKGILLPYLFLSIVVIILGISIYLFIYYLYKHNVPARLGGWRQLRVWGVGGRYRRGLRLRPVAEEWPTPVIKNKTPQKKKRWAFDFFERHYHHSIWKEKKKSIDYIQAPSLFFLNPCNRRRGDILANHVLCIQQQQELGWSGKL